MPPFLQFIRSASKLAVGNVGAQAISVGTAALLGRLFAPTAVGEYYLIFSIAGMMALVSTGRYESAIITVQGRRIAYLLYRISMLLNGMTFAFLFATLLFFSIISSYRPLADWNLEWPFGIILVFHMGIHQTLMAYTNRCAMFGAMTRARIIAALGNLAAVAAGALYARSPEILIAASTASYLAAIIYLYWTLRHQWSVPLHTSRKRYAVVIARYWKFPAYGIPTGFLNSLVYAAPLFLLSIFYGAATSGSFAMAQRIISLPMNMVTSAAAEVFRADVLAAGSNENIRSVYRRTARILATGAIPFAILGVLAAPWVITFILGQLWETASIFATILIPMYAARLIGSPLGYMPIFYRRLDLDFYFQLGWAIALGCVCALSACLLSDMITITVYAAINCIAFLIYIFWSWRLVVHQGRLPFFISAARS
jgi:O-antigen/teichoic acid export membrane protein